MSLKTKQDALGNPSEVMFNIKLGLRKKWWGEAFRLSNK